MKFYPGCRAPVDQSRQNLDSPGGDHGARRGSARRPQQLGLPEATHDSARVPGLLGEEAQRIRNICADQLKRDD